MSPKEPEVLSACLIKYVDGARGYVTEKVLMQFPLRSNEQESANSSDRMQTRVPEGESLKHRHIWLAGTAFSPLKVWWGYGEDPTKQRGVPCKVHGDDFGQCLDFPEERSLRSNPWIFYPKLTLSCG